jgi:thiol:disulfide interchange protein
MNRRSLTRGMHVLALAAACGLSAFASGQDEADAPARKNIYDEKADGAAQVEEALARAKAENRSVLIQWGANWCGWCHLLHDTFESDEAVKRKLLYEYDVVLIDIGRFDKNLELATRFNADFKSNGVPFLTVLDAEGKPLANQETGSLELKDAPKPGHDAKKVLAFLEKHQATYLPAESVLESGLARARKENKVVFLHFGAPWCHWCRNLEKWMARPEVGPVMGKAFVDVKVDTDRMIGGHELMRRYTGGKSTGIPFFVFLRPNGDVLRTSFDEDGKNLGCPWSPDEIAVFKAIIADVTTRMDAKDIDAVTSYLGKRKTTGG